jgi:WS/DGAT/MGAT family acyltransferase
MKRIGPPSNAAVKVTRDASVRLTNSVTPLVPLSGLDGAFLTLETPATPMHVGSLHVFTKPRGYKGDFYRTIKRRLAGRMDVAPIFRRRLAPMPLQFANPVWVADDNVDLDFHVRRVPVPAPGSLAALEACVATLHSELMDRSRPLWMVYVFERLAAGRLAFYIKIHHAVLDGAASVALADAFFDTSPQPRRRSHRNRHAARGGHAPAVIALASAAFRHDAAQYVKLLRHIPELVRTLATVARDSDTGTGGQLWRNFSFGPRTPLNVTVTAERGFVGLSIPLAEVKAVAAKHAVTVNDVVLALCSGALRRYLARHGGIPKKPLIAAMPISLREPGNMDFTIEATMIPVSLATHIADPVRRLRAVHAAAEATKSVARRAKSVIPTDFPSIGVPWILGALTSLVGRSHVADAIPPIANVVISNIAGVPVPLYSAGARMYAYWPLSIVEHGLGLNITVMSYAGRLGFGFTVASCAVPDPRELAADLTAAHVELHGHSPSRLAAPARLAARRSAKTRKPPVPTTLNRRRSNHVQSA